MRDVTAVAPVALALFAGRLQVGQGVDIVDLRHCYVIVVLFDWWTGPSDNHCTNIITSNILLS